MSLSPDPISSVADQPSTEGSAHDLEAQIKRLASVPVLLVASDYDGTLAPIVDDPEQAFPDPDGLVALRRLAELPRTEVCLISGRALADLRRLSGAEDPIRLIGSHGSEFALGFATHLNSEQLALREQLLTESGVLAARHPGASVEAKPAGIAFHYRRVAQDDQPAARAAALELARSAPGVHVREGKCVVELAVTETDKGSALEETRRRVGASAVLFLGDDQTDEDAFALLHGPDVAVKVGDGESQAPHRLSGPREVSRALALLLEARRAHFEGGAFAPIEQHSLLSDQRALALVAPGARINWMCAPRFDSPALFAELLGGPGAGAFGIRPLSDTPAPKASYRGPTGMLETRFGPGPRAICVLDYLDVSGGRPLHRAGRSDLVRVVTGHGTIEIEFAPRLDFGRRPTRLEITEHGLAICGTNVPIRLHAPGIQFELLEEGRHHTARARVELTGDPLVLELCHGGHGPQPKADELTRQMDNEAWWTNWASRIQTPQTASELVMRSALTLRSLQYGPTGALIAAGTTSLPEWLGGVRNWDYRYTWLRDAAMSVEALTLLGSTGEAMRFLDWMFDLLEEVDGPETLRPLYDVRGRDLPPEAEISELTGYRGSRPVRVGNAACEQVQLDVFGPVASLVHTLSECDVPLAPHHAELLEAMVHAVQLRWREPDHGIWEIRGAPRHHVHSKLMCWLTVDRAMRVFESLGREVPDAWGPLRGEILAELLERGWNEQRQAFTAAYGADDLDAALLMLGTCGALDPADPRFRTTVEAIEAELREGPTVYRYRGDDGLPGREGGFHLLTSWLVDAYWVLGRSEDARGLFEELTGLAGETGLLSEQVEPNSRMALGNHPQAYSHLGVIHNALRFEGRSIEHPRPQPSEQ